MKQCESESWFNYYDRLVKNHNIQMNIIKHGHKTFQERKKLRTLKVK